MAAIMRFCAVEKQSSGAYNCLAFTSPVCDLFERFWRLAALSASVLVGLGYGEMVIAR